MATVAGVEVAAKARLAWPVWVGDGPTGGERGGTIADSSGCAILAARSILKLSLTECVYFIETA